MLVPISPEEIKDNPFELIARDWMLITAGPPDAFNTMTASWGGVGHIWDKNVCWCVIRPGRYTREFMERNNVFTLSFFKEEHRPALQFLGSRSGRDGEKVSGSGLTPMAGPVAGTTTFAEARLVIACRKIYYHDLDPSHFLVPEIERCYPEKDYHRMYIGEILQVVAEK
jgi:flavin reductase (DIM6/NTAB) family NADH-FMN oxidoreductase RutF